MAKITLPPYLMTSEPGSFAEKTIKERKPIIIDRILSHYGYTDEIRQSLLAFKDELARGSIQPLKENTSDRTMWNQAITAWEAETWLSLPWFLAETYFYRRVLEITAYFQPGPWAGRDPYGRLKDETIEQALPAFTDIYGEMSFSSSEEAFNAYFYKALWGNRGDLSNMSTFDEDMSDQSHQIIRNDLHEAFRFMTQKPSSIALFLDNTGKELLFDLALVDFLIQTHYAHHFTFYLKNQPFFVSDVMPKDLKKALNLLSASKSRKNQHLASRLTKGIRSGQIRIEAPPFFTTSSMYREFPKTLSDQIGRHDLVILKGDVNYRRLFGDRHWPKTTPVDLAAAYFPTSFLSLRTLKGEIVLGLDQATVTALETRAEADWLINGNRGVITFHQKNH
jgi:hypothetical protein